MALLIEFLYVFFCACIVGVDVGKLVDRKESVYGGGVPCPYVEFFMFLTNPL